jgi:O-acetyl-ADP-ribose deacetylase (regulator of RNase III)
MAIHIVEGNLITMAQEGVFDAIVHGCNCFNTMGAGIAPQIAEAFPEAYLVDQMTKRGELSKMGNITISKTWTNDHYTLIINGYTQYHYNKPYLDTDIPLSYEHLAEVFLKLNVILAGKKLGMPWIGCGLAGGDKSEVKQLIEDCLSDVCVTIVEYKP